MTHREGLHSWRKSVEVIIGGDCRAQGDMSAYTRSRKCTMTDWHQQSNKKDLLDCVTHTVEAWREEGANEACKEAKYLLVLCAPSTNNTRCSCMTSSHL